MAGCSGHGLRWNHPAKKMNGIKEDSSRVSQHARPSRYFAQNNFLQKRVRRKRNLCFMSFCCNSFLVKKSLSWKTFFR